MQLFARIKKNSKYYHQNPGRGKAFEVEIDADYICGEKGEIDNYCVQGGPGGQYRLCDVNLFVQRSDGLMVRIK